MSLFNDETRHPLLPNADQIAMRSLNYTPPGDMDMPIEETMEVYGDDDGREITDDEIKAEQFDIARHALAMCMVTDPHFHDSSTQSLNITTTTFIILLDALNITDEYLSDVEAQFMNELRNKKGYWSGGQ